MKMKKNNVARTSAEASILDTNFDQDIRYLKQ